MITQTIILRLVALWYRYHTSATDCTRGCLPTELGLPGRDIVSKNGNLLLSIPLRGDGSIDEDERQFLTQLAAWMKLNGEAVFGTRPWRVFGEGPTRVKAGRFGEGGESEFTADDIRFTQKGDTLFALVAAGLTVDLPTALPGEHVFAFKIRGRGLIAARG